MLYDDAPEIEAHELPSSDAWLYMTPADLLAYTYATLDEVNATRDTIPAPPPAMVA